jgi:hypothetical protein
MTELLQKAIGEMTKLPAEQQDELATWILEKLASPDLKTEEEWEAEVLTEALGEAIRPDGTIDFDKLEATGLELTQQDLYPEGEMEEPQ